MNDTLQLVVAETIENAEPQVEQVEQVAIVTVTAASMNGVERRQEVLRQAAEHFQIATDWVTFFRLVLGVEGVVRRNFSVAEELISFEQTPEFDQIQQMLAKLRERKEEPNVELEPTRVITVRLPKSVHESLKAEAHDRHMSMNRLCISKLLQMIDNELVSGD